MGLFLLGLPIIVILLFLLVNNKFLIQAISIIASGILLGLSLFVAKEVLLAGIVSYDFLGGLFYVDALSALFLNIVTILGFIVNIYSVGYINEDLRSGKIDIKALRIYYILLFTFIFTMILSLTVQNMGIMWVAIEATTLASAFLVGFYNKKESLEAAWKYVIICSVGIAIAFLGIIFIHLSSFDIIQEADILNWPVLMENATSLQTPILRIAFLFILVGFGTKAGLAPMHTWLPGAHSQAPSPISALLSGVLLNSAMYGIIRTVAIVNKNLGGNEFTSIPLMGFGMISIVMAAILILSQKEYKALLAYSSIEHMGVIAFALGIFSPVAIIGALLHTINHSFTKSMLFLSAGNILQKYETGEINKIKSILKIMPVSGTIFLLGLLAIAGVPPFSIFSSEFNIMIAIFDDGKYLIGGIFVLLLAIIFSGIVYRLFGMFYGKVDNDATITNASNPLGTISMIILLVIISITGIYLPQEVMQLINSAMNIIMGV